LDGDVLLRIFKPYTVHGNLESSAGGAFGDNFEQDTQGRDDSWEPIIEEFGLRSVF
jgi:hypothetical protein